MQKYDKEITQEDKMLFQNMSKVIGRPASFEGLAEEAIELAEAALIASEESDDGPDDYITVRTVDLLQEEFNDVVLFCLSLGIEAGWHESDHIFKSWPDLYRKLAKSCTNLAKSALKEARCIRKESPTPVTEEEALENVKHYYQEVRDLALNTGLYTDSVQIHQKYLRFESRCKTQEGK